MSLWSKIDKAERKDDTNIRLEGLTIGRVYHIRPALNGKGPLMTGDYRIRAFDFGTVCGTGFCTATWAPLGGQYFRIEGIDKWFPFDETFVFSEVSDG